MIVLSRVVHLLELLQHFLNWSLSPSVGGRSVDFLGPAVVSIILGADPFLLSHCRCYYLKPLVCGARGPYGPFLHAYPLSELAGSLRTCGTKDQSSYGLYLKSSAL